MKKDYRCSCCNEIKNEKGNIVYKLWSQKVKPENSPVVGICRGCNNKMKRANILGVQQFLKWGFYEKA